MGERGVLAVAVLVVLAVGVAAATGHQGELNAAYAETDEVEELVFEFTADSTTDVTATDTVSDGDVTFSFARWQGGGNSGTGTTWNVQAGTTYEVVYEATAPQGTTEGGYSGTVEVQSSDGWSKSETLQIDVLHPQFGNVDSPSVELPFESPDGGSVTVDVDVPNTGSGIMLPTEIRFEGVPSGFTVDGGVPNRIDGNSVGKANIEIAADDTVGEGTYSFDAIVEDNLGNSERFTVYVEVTKPPNLEVPDGHIDVGDVLAGDSKTVEFTIEEVNGFEGISGVSYDVRSSAQFGEIGFPGLGYVSTQPGGSDTAEVTLSVGEDAFQHANLDWTVYLQPNDENGVGQTVSVTGRVIYPPYFGSMSLGDPTMTFDQPKSSTTTQRETITLAVPNDGDQEMTIRDVDVTVEGAAVETDADYPSTIPGQETGTVDIRLAADADQGEGTYPMSVTIEAAEAGTKTVEGSLRIEHGVELSVERTTLDYGDVTVTSRLTQSTDLAEQLEYKDVTGVTIQKVSGPDRWLTVVEEPSSTITAGTSAPFVVAVQFDTSATLYQEYEWVFEVRANEVENRTIVVTATPEPYTFEDTREPLAEYAGGSGWDAETAGGMVEVLDTLESNLKDGENVSRSDLATSIAAGRSALLTVESVHAAEETIDSEGRREAHDDVLRAAAALNMLKIYASQLESQELRSSARKSVAAADERVSTLIDEQVAYHESTLADENVSVIETARTKRQVAQLAVLRGNRERAATLEAESAAAFERYGELVAAGTDHYRTATERHDAMIGTTGDVFVGDATTVVVFGLQLAPNPAKWDAFGEDAETVATEFDAAVAAYDEAGAGEEADRVASEREETLASLRMARYSLYAFTGGYGLGFLGLVVHMVRTTHAFVRDAREATTGDFLV